MNARFSVPKIWIIFNQPKNVFITFLDVGAIFKLSWAILDVEIDKLKNAHLENSVLNVKGNSNIIYIFFIQ